MPERTAGYSSNMLPMAAANRHEPRIQRKKLVLAVTTGFGLFMSATGNDPDQIVHSIVTTPAHFIYFCINIFDFFFLRKYFLASCLVVWIFDHFVFYFFNLQQKLFLTAFQPLDRAFDIGPDILELIWRTGKFIHQFFQFPETNAFQQLDHFLFESIEMLRQAC